MCQCLPTGKFIEIEISKRNIDNSVKINLDTKDDHKLGYFTECDLKYPQKIHRKTKQLPLSSEKTVKLKRFSAYMTEKTTKL